MDANTLLALGFAVLIISVVISRAANLDNELDDDE